MAKALICDVCGKTFAQTASEGANGKWTKVRSHVNGNPIYIVYGTFTPPPRAMLARLTMPVEDVKGVPTDVCPKCTLTLIARYLTEDLEETSNDSVPEGGNEEHSRD